MPRLPRISPANIAVHIIQRGNNRQSCFVSDEDHWAYINLLKFPIKALRRHLQQHGYDRIYHGFAWSRA